MQNHQTSVYSARPKLEPGIIRICTFSPAYEMPSISPVRLEAVEQKNVHAQALRSGIRRFILH
jgi:hypothetical protein